MQSLLILILVAHGLVHMIGFAKAYSLANLNQLRVPISQPFGLLWLGTAILFLLSAFFLNVGWTQWWTVALMALVCSQLSISLVWSDAKYGSIANLIILIAVVSAVLGYAP